MRKIIIVGCIITIFLMIFTPNIYAIKTDFVESRVEIKKETSGPRVTVHGGLGLNIDVYDVDDDTIFGVMINGALIIYQHISPTILKHFNAHILTLNFLWDTFILHITVDNQIWSYECYAFFCYIIEITPVHL